MARDVQPGVGRMSRAVETVMVTGSSRGIGLELVRQSLERGRRVIAASRASSPELDAVGAAHRDRFILVRMDPGDEESIISARKSLEGRVDVLHLLINNAGVYSKWSENWNADATLFDTVTRDELMDVYRINAVGPMLVIQHFLNLLRHSRRGRILNLSSLLGSVSVRTSPGDYAYSASKAALNIMTRALAAELTPDGIVAIVITPGWVRTEMGGRAAPLTPRESAEGILDVAGRLTPRDAGRFIDYQGEEQPW